MPDDQDRIAVLEERIARLEALLARISGGGEGPVALAAPPNVADGDVITAAHINAIKNAIFAWVADVAAAGYQLVNTGKIGIGTASPEGNGLHVAGANVAGVDAITGVLLDRSYDTVGDSMDIVWGSGSGMAGNRFGRIACNAVGAGETGLIFYATTAAGDAFTNEIFRIQGNGTVKMKIGAALKTLSVDGSGFVKAA